MQKICFSFMTYHHPFFDKFDYIDGEMLVYSLNTFAVLPLLSFLLAIKKKRSALNFGGLKCLLRFYLLTNIWHSVL